MFLSDNMAHSQSLLPYIWVCKLYSFLTEERRKEKGALFMKVMFVLIVHKKKCRQKVTAAKGYTITA